MTVSVPWRIRWYREVQGYGAVGDIHGMSRRGSGGEGQVQCEERPEGSMGKGRAMSRTGQVVEGVVNEVHPSERCPSARSA